MKLYNLSESIIFNVIENGKRSSNNSKTIYELKSSGNKYPIKVVTIMKNDYLLIITVYPLKREIEK